MKHGLEFVELNCVRQRRADDIVLLVCVVGLAMATWAAVSGGDGVSGSKVCFGVLATMFLSIAALTPRAFWAVVVRLAMSCWLVVAPWLLTLAANPLVRWSYLLASSLIAAMSLPHLLRHAVWANDRGTS